ncbi:MAG: S8 family serine peptidase [Planctomycetota bacterium]|jgi:hypothetical protein
MSIADCQISHNTARTSGGGVYLGGDNDFDSLIGPELKNCLITNNRASRDGAGVSCNWYVEAAISNCTIAYNAVTDPNSYGGGVYCSYDSNVEVIDSIIWRNRGSNGAQIAVGSGDLPYPLPAALTITYSDIGPRYDPSQAFDFGSVGTFAGGSATGGAGTVLVDSQSIYGKFDSGQEKVKVIVSLDEPAAIKATTDWSSPQSVGLLRAEIAARQAAVISTLLCDEFTLRYQYENQAAFSGEVTIGCLNKLLADPLVAHVEPVRTVKKVLAQAIPLANALEARQVYDGTGIAVAIVDTGVDYTHPMLGNGGFPNAKVIGGYDTGEGDGDPMPANAHGTACAGIAAGDLGRVGDYIGGVAYNAKIYALKIADADGVLTTDGALAAWDWCVTHRDDDPQNPIKVISNSWGSPEVYNDVTLAEAAYPAGTAAAENATAAGIAVLGASGNEYSTDGIIVPAALGSVISVGAVHDTTDEVTDYSNTDEILDILAPAEPMYTTDIVGAGGYDAGDYVPDFAGTSSACPFAAGAVACLQHAALVKFGSYLSPAEVRDLLIETGDPITDTKVAITKPRVNLGAAIAAFTYGPPIYVEQGCMLNDWQAPDTNNYWGWDADTWPDSHNIEEDPCFVNIAEQPDFIAGYYLSQVAAGQPVDSPCINVGSGSVTDPGIDIDPDEHTTRTDGFGDFGIVDMGYHYLIDSMPRLTVTIIDANGQAVTPGLAPGDVEPYGDLLYPEGSIVQLTAYPDCIDIDNCYRVKWRGTDDDSSTEPNNIVTMTRDRNVTVEFELIPKCYLTTIVLGGHGSIEPVSGYQLEGAVELTAIPEPDYRVRKWTGTDYDLSTEPNNVVTLTEDKVVFVMFEFRDIIEVSPDDPNAIQAAIDDAGDGDILIVAAGTYDGNINLRGKAITVTSTNPEDPNIVAQTIIDCQESGRGFIFNSGEEADTIVDGLAIINGSVTGENGGGIYIDSNSSPTLRNLIISNCSATAADPNGGGNGGGIYVDADTSPVFVNCTVTNCTADSNGGGAYCDVNSSAVFKHCTFIENSAVLGGGLYYHSVAWASEVNDCNFVDNLAQSGAALYFDPNSSGAVVGTIFERNDANQDGGAIYLVDANSVSIVDCIVTDNSAYRGAGLYCESSLAVSIIDCEIKRNRAPDVIVVDPNDPNDPNISIVGQGGGIWCWGTPALISGCVITHNIANTSGGGIYLTGGPNSPHITNCLIVNNLAGRDGGGVSANWYTQSSIALCTFSGNAASGTFGRLTGNTGFGGGLYCGYNSNTVVADCILWNNYAYALEGGHEIAVGTGFDFGYLWPATLTVSYSDVEGKQSGAKVDDGCTLNWGTGNINADPLFVTGALGNYYLSQTAAGQSQNSPCVDAGSDDASFFGMTSYTTRTDEVFDKGAVDMGYHYPLSLRYEPCRFCDLFRDGFIDFYDYAVFALHWLDEGCSDVDDWCGGADFTFDASVDYNDLGFFAACWLLGDTQPPIPNPSEWEIEPYSISATPPYGISMTAKISYDAWGWNVQYYFECVSDGSYSSGWQSSRTYAVTGLAADAELCFKVRARDELGYTTAWSVVRCASVPPPTEDTTPPAPAPYVVVSPNSPNTVTMEVPIPSHDFSGVEYYFECTSGGGHDSGWLSFAEGELPTYTDYDLEPETTYCYRVMARDKSPQQNPTGWSVEDCATTPKEPDKTPPSPDPMLWDFSVMDVNGYMIDGRPHYIWLGPDPIFDYYVTMRADPNTVDMPVDSEYDVEFYFECTTTGGFSSPGWLSYPEGPPYIYTVRVGQYGLVHKFRVKARDTSPNHNDTAWSTEERVP